MARTLLLVVFPLFLAGVFFYLSWDDTPDLPESDPVVAEHDYRPKWEPATAPIMPKEETEAYTDETIKRAGMILFKQQNLLKDPDSFQVISEGVERVQDIAVYSLTYRAKNSFGGFSIETWETVMPANK